REPAWRLAGELLVSHHARTDVTRTNATAYRPDSFTFLDASVFWRVATEISLLSLHDALPILPGSYPVFRLCPQVFGRSAKHLRRSEEHTSELQSRENLVCRLLLEKTN